MREINWLVIHTSATRPSMDIGAKDIRRWHKAKGWSDIGYHYVIRRDGRVEKGRPDARVGAHVRGYNRDSLGVCLVGGVNENLVPENNYTEAQWEALEALLRKLSKKYPNAFVRGHRDFPRVAKACPCFDAEPWAYKKGFKVKSVQKHWVKEIKHSRTVAGASMTGLGIAGNQLKDTANEVSILAAYTPWISAISAVLMVIGVGFVLYARINDARNNPKFSGVPEPSYPAD